MVTMNNAAVAIATKELDSNTEKNAEKVDECQVHYICNAFEKAKKLDGNYCTGMEPLIIKGDARIKCGVCELIELRGYFSRDTAEKAVFTLKDSGSICQETIIEIVTDEQGIVTRIRFMYPKIRMRFQANY